LKPNEHAYEDKTEDERSPSPVKFGFDLELELKNDSSAEEKLDEDLMDWIEDVTGNISPWIPMCF